MKILVIEDDTDIREALVFLLESEGYEVAAAENGKAALDLLSQGRNPELILVDLFMPVMDGLTFRKKQLGRPEIAKIPVILMSADWINAGVYKVSEDALDASGKPKPKYYACISRLVKRAALSLLRLATYWNDLDQSNFWADF